MRPHKTTPTISKPSSLAPTTTPIEKLLPKYHVYTAATAMQLEQAWLITKYNVRLSTKQWTVKQANQVNKIISIKKETRMTINHNYYNDRLLKIIYNKGKDVSY
jgi:hypothetical protein